MPRAFFAVPETALTTSRTGWKSLSPLLSGRLVFAHQCQPYLVPPGLAKLSRLKVRIPVRAVSSTWAMASFVPLYQTTRSSRLRDGVVPGQRCTTWCQCHVDALGNVVDEVHRRLDPKVRYYLENRDAEFERKMAEVLCVYREVEVLKKACAKSDRGKPVAIVSCDEKPGIQAIATTAPDLPPEPGIHPTFARDHEYKRHGTLSLLAGIDLLTGKVHALVKDRHRSREFIEFLKLLDAAYPAGTAIKLILDNHSAHISKETKAWLATRPAGRFELTFTPTHGSWLNLIEGFFSKLTRSVLRHIRVASKLELKQRIMAGIRDINRRPVIHTWSYKLAEAA